MLESIWHQNLLQKDSYYKANFLSNLVSPTLSFLSLLIALDGKMTIKIIFFATTLIFAVIWIFSFFEYRRIFAERIRKQTEKETRKELEPDENLLIMKKDLKKYINNLQPFFDSGISYSFYKIMFNTKQDNEAQRFHIINEWFYGYHRRFPEIFNIEQLCEEIVQIIRKAEQMFDNFNANKLSKIETFSNIKKNYDKLIKDYPKNRINLQNYFREISEKVNIPHYDFNPLPTENHE